jgi:hypothetical protein
VTNLLDRGDDVGIGAAAAEIAAHHLADFIRCFGLGFAEQICPGVQ